MRRLNDDNACLPPATDCLCYAPAYYLEVAAIDIQSKCYDDADALEQTAATLESNCKALNQQPAVNSAEFIAMGRYTASDTLRSSPEGTGTFDPATVPSARSTSGQSTVESVQTTFSGVTTEPGVGSAPTTSLSIGPAPISPTSSASSSSTASSTSGASKAYFIWFSSKNVIVVVMVSSVSALVFLLGTVIF